MDLVRSIRRIWGRKGVESVYNSQLGVIYPPPYSSNLSETLRLPSVYNANGERMDFFFLRDRHMAHDPYCSENPPTHWLWDRYNVGLRTHFYTHWEMLRKMGHPDRCYGLLMESEPLCPADYRMFQTHAGVEKDFDLIFTYNERILNEVPNARFFPFFACSLFGTEAGGGSWCDTAYEHKTKMISICSAAKMMCDLHRYRIELAQTCKREGLADTYGTFDGGPLVKIAATLRDYRYSIVVENDLSRFFFTQKITDCFASMTIPIYCGTSSIGEFFNEDGIMRINPGDDVRKVLSQCSEKDYLARLPAMLDNYQRAYAYRNMWDWLFEKYLNEGR